jgi:putative ABC transport system permease protein
MNLAIFSGVVTTIVSASVLVFQVCRVTPLTAMNPEARPPRTVYLYASAVVGVGLLGLHEWMVATDEPTRWLHTAFISVGSYSLYLGYVFLAPILVVWLGPLIARVVGPLMGLRARLAEDQFGRAPWRSTGVCWMLLVGLSLIVYIAVGAETVLAIWNFPGRLPETFVWSRKCVDGQVLERVREIPGVAKATGVVDVDCEIVTPDAEDGPWSDSVVGTLLNRLTRPVFVGGEPDELLGWVKVTFDEGSMEDALAKLKRGGYVLIPTQTARNKGLHLGDRVAVGIKGRSADFEIAGVVQSPILDLAVTAFQATSYMDYATAATLIGSREDLKRKFDLDVVSMIMCDLNLPPSPPPAEFYEPRCPNRNDAETLARLMVDWHDSLPNEQDAQGLPGQHAPRAGGATDPLSTATNGDHEKLRDRYERSLRRVAWTWHRDTPEQRWFIFRERMVLWKIAQEMERPDAIVGSMHRLKAGLDKGLRRATSALTWLPSIILAVAAIGVGNLMMVSVQIRARQIAVLRAVGAVRSQIIRLVLAEAVALGLLGSVIGLALGVHLAMSDNRITGSLLGFEADLVIPIGRLAMAIALTLVVCLLAGIIPARYAARSNIIAAMQTT